MRWDNLFDDLESQLEHGLTVEEIDLQAEGERLRLARMTVRDRIASIHENAADASEAEVQLVLTGGLRVTVSATSFGKDWFSGHLVDESRRRSECIVPLAAVAGLVLCREQLHRSLSTSESPRPLSARLGLAFVLRDLCRRRSSVELQLAEGVVHGTIDRVGRDHLDLAVHEPGSVRRESEVAHYRVVLFGEILLVRVC